jgi:hypothetical protein
VQVISLETQSCTMASFSLKPQHNGSSSMIYHTICSTASEWRSLLRSRSSVSWSWKKHTRLRLRCCQGSDGGDDSRLSQNTGIFHPSIWGDFFLGCSSSPDEAAASSQQKVHFIYLSILYMDPIDHLFPVVPLY